MTTQQFPFQQAYQDIDPALRGEVIEVPAELVRKNTKLFIVKGVIEKSVAVLLNHKPTPDATNCLIQIKKADGYKIDIGYLQCFCHGCLVEFIPLNYKQQFYYLLHQHGIRILVTTNGEYAHKSCIKCHDISLEVKDIGSMNFSTLRILGNDFPHFSFYTF